MNTKVADLINKPNDDVIAFNSTSTYLHDLLNPDKPYTESMVNQIRMPEL